MRAIKGFSPLRVILPHQFSADHHPYCIRNPHAITGYDPLALIDHADVLKQVLQKPVFRPGLLSSRCRHSLRQDTEIIENPPPGYACRGIHVRANSLRRSACGPECIATADDTLHNAASNGKHQGCHLTPASHCNDAAPVLHVTLLPRRRARALDVDSFNNLIGHGWFQKASAPALPFRTTPSVTAAQTQGEGAHPKCRRLAKTSTSSGAAASRDDRDVDQSNQALRCS